MVFLLIEVQTFVVALVLFAVCKEVDHAYVCKMHYCGVNFKLTISLTLYALLYAEVVVPFHQFCVMQQKQDYLTST